MALLKYLKGYDKGLQAEVQTLIDAGRLGDLLRSRHPCNHEIRTSKALYDYTIEIKNEYLRKTGPLSKVIYDDKISLSHQALGLHSFISRAQGRKTKAKNEIRISSRLKRSPEALMRTVVVHELAHLREKDHNKSFYNLCTHMDSDYHQNEFDLRLYLTYVDLGKTLHA